MKEGSSGKWIVREVGCEWVGEGFGLRVLSGTLAVNDKKNWRGTCLSVAENEQLDGDVGWGGKYVQGGWMGKK